MNLKTVVLTCEKFLKNFGTHKLDELSQVNSKYFEQFCNLSSLWDSKSINDQDSLEFSEAWNSILICYKVVLDKISTEIRINSEKISKGENNQLNFKEKQLLKLDGQLSSLFFTEMLFIKQFLIDLLEIIKELTLTCENMKSCLESNVGLTNSSSTNSLSIVLILVKIICYKIETTNRDLLEKIYGSTLYCLNILFRIYKIEFTENWDLILFPEEFDVTSIEFNSLLHNGISIYLNVNSDIPFLPCFLFSSNTKMRVNTMLCIQSIFTSPIFRFKPMISLLCKPLSEQILDTSASSLSKNAVILTFSLLKFGETFFKSESYDLDTGITLIKTVSKIVNTTPSLFWTNNFMNAKISFINILSNNLHSGLKDLNFFIPSLQLFSNILSLIKNCETSKNILIDDLNPCFEQVLINSYLTLNIQRDFNYESINGKNVHSKLPVILTEILNFYIKLLENFPLLLLSIYLNQSLFYENKFGVKNYLSMFVNLLEFINFNPGQLDPLIYEKGLRATYMLINCIREFRKVRINKKNLVENQIQFLDSDSFPQSVKKLEFTTINVEESYFKIAKYLKSFIFFTCDSVIDHLIIFKEELTNSSNFFQINKNCICRILDIYSTINPIILEEALSETLMKAVHNIKSNNKKILYKNEKIKQCILKTSKISFIELLLLILDSAEDRILPSLINVLLCYCGSSEWTKHSSFTTFQHFETTLVQKLLFLIKFDNSNTMKPIKENIILCVNKAMVYISTYHYINTNKVIICSSNYRKNNINLLEENYYEFMHNYEVEFNEICCLLNWKEIFFSYKLLIQHFKSSLTSSKASNLSNFSEIIRVFGRILRLIPFNLNDSEDIVWTLNLLSNFILNICKSTLRYNKVKWNSIYAIGLLFENDHFYNLAIQAFNDIANTHIDLSKAFTKSWKALCLIIINKTELTKVRISALRSLTVFNKISSDFDFKIPFILLFDTWETFKFAMNIQLVDKTTSYDKLQTANNEYSKLWSIHLNQLGLLLYKNSQFYLKNSSNKFTYFEKERIIKYCSEFVCKEESA
ncbi:uncharacterized protein ELE39_003334 [Cryptosporidium sp. chipmunk genotype I]|uniref:uncharacterized protein n=1 Tax=Cryptosporidium sp. chipmunk genotype I TaxID=1280935 RepID=UPI00351A7B5A|nr:hypothetical protein ELE39_003334 [Cryptosporidium sp. chipmunk genotype I]